MMTGALDQALARHRSRAGQNAGICEIGQDVSPSTQPDDGRLPSKVCHICPFGANMGAAEGTVMGRVGGKMAELLMNSATVESRA